METGEIMSEINLRRNIFIMTFDKLCKIKKHVVKTNEIMHLKINFKFDNNSCVFITWCWMILAVSTAGINLCFSYIYVEIGYNLKHGNTLTFKSIPPPYFARLYQTF